MTDNIDNQNQNQNQNQIDVHAANSIDSAVCEQYYDNDALMSVINTALTTMQAHIDDGLILPYFSDIDAQSWHDKPKAVDVYITDTREGRALNMEARGKDYATNILSYPSALPVSVIDMMPVITLGELIICHDVVVKQASEQNKTISQHLTHLLVHGVLHLLGFDHEIGQAEANEMEAFEIEILAHLGLPNPYIVR